MKVAILVLSDKGARGERKDTSGPTLEQWLTDHGARVMHLEVIPDEQELIEIKLMGWADSGALDLLLTCGGTGVSPRDVTPEATSRVVERVIPGFGEEMRRRSREKTPNALISRAMAGIRGRSLIVNLPGSPRGAIENLEAIWPAIPHAIGKIQGDPGDCASN